MILAKEEEGMKWLIRRLEDYLKGKGLILSEDKTKVLRFGKRGGSRRKEIWRWKESKLEEVIEFIYLGYKFKWNGHMYVYIEYISNNIEYN